MPNQYQHTIHNLDPTINPAGVEASMRLQFGTLDHLSIEDFRDELAIARQCEQEQPGFLRRTAASYGLEKDFQAWQPKLQQANPNPAETTNTTWMGQRISERLQIHPSQDDPTLWTISGEATHLSALATPHDLLRLAQLINEHFAPSDPS